jgi:hypothetical protein
VPKPSISPSSRRKSLHRKAVLVTAAVALVAGTVAVLAPDDEPVETATEFLAAVRAKDLDRVAALSSLGRIAPDARGPFLTARALRSDWQVSAIEEESRDSDQAAVRYELSGAGRRVDGVVELAYDDDTEGWRVVNPTVLVDIPHTPFRSLQVNGLHVERPYVAGADGTYFDLLPGIYEFPVRHVAGDPGGRPTVELVTDRHVGKAGPALPVTVPYTLGAGWWSAVAGGVQAVLDACVQRAEVGLPGCPFGAAEPLRRSDGTELTEPRDVEWEIVESPPLDQTADRTTGERDSLTLSSSAPGVARLTLSGETPNGRRERFSCDTEIRLERLVAGVEADGTVVVDEAGTRYDGAPRPPFPCREESEDD